MVSHVNKHILDLKEIVNQHRMALEELESTTGLLLFNLIYKRILYASRNTRKSSFFTKNKKISSLNNNNNIKRKISYNVPVINLSSIELTENELKQLSYGLEHSFVDKNKHIKKDLGANLEFLAQSVDKHILDDKREHFHEFLRAYCDMLTKNTYSTRDSTYSNLKRLIKNEDIVIIPGDKDSCVVIMNKSDYVQKLQQMINDGIEKGVYAESENNTIVELNRFNDFINRHFQSYKHFERMKSSSNTPAQLYSTTKTHKFENISDITVDSLKFRPIIAQTGTYTYNTAQVISEYLKPLYINNEYIIHNTQDFPNIRQNQPSLNENEELYVESLFTNVPIDDIIEYILDEIYIHKKLPKLCSRLIMKRLLLKLTTENTFIFQSNYFKQIDACTMGGSLSVTFANIFLTKLEKDIVRPHNLPFYKRFVDDVITRRSINQPDLIFSEINEYHPNIKFTTETNPRKFLDTELIIIDNKIITSVYRKPNKLPIHWSSKIPKRYKLNMINADLNCSYRISMDFQAEKEIIIKKFLNADFPTRFIHSVIKQFEEKSFTPDDLIIPEFLFAESRQLILLEITFCESNELLSKRFLTKLKSFTNDKIDFAIKWVTKKVRKLFRVKDKNPHPACKIYEGICSCTKNYIGETKRNAEVRWSEHENITKDSEPAKHLRNFTDHKFEWRVIFNGHKNTRIRKNIEASLIAFKKPSLNDQLDSRRLILFRNGIT